MSKSHALDLRVPTAAIVAALIAGWSIPDHAFGLNFVLTGLAIAVAVLMAHGRPWWPAATFSLLLVGFFAVRAAEWLLALNLLAAVGLAAVALVDVRGFRALLKIPLALAGSALRGPAAVAAPLVVRLRSITPPERRPLVRGVATASLLVTVFGGLFFSADAAFAHLAAETLIPDWNMTLFPARGVLLAGVFAFASALIMLPERFSRSQEPDPWRGQHPERPERRSLQRVEWVIALGALNLLFLGFVVVQVAVLFGGRTHVLTTTGMTYAEYARQGFFQLLVVAALVLGLVAWIVLRADSGQVRDRAWLRVLLGALCILTLVILASAFRRLDLYEEAYGFTRLRLSVHATIIWIAAVFALLLTAGALWRAEWLPRAVVLMTGAGLLAFNLMNPDATIARENIERFERTGRIDTGYLATLSADALPVLMELPADQRACPVSVIAKRLDHDGSPFAFNISRGAAERLSQEHALAEQKVPLCYL